MMCDCSRRSKNQPLWPLAAVSHIISGAVPLIWWKRSEVMNLVCDWLRGLSGSLWRCGVFPCYNLVCNVTNHNGSGGHAVWAFFQLCVSPWLMVKCS